MNYDSLLADPTARIARRPYIAALLTLLAAFVFYYVLVRGGSGRFGMLVMLYPAAMLLMGRLRGMGRPAWLAAAPAALIVAAFWLGSTQPGAPLHREVTWATFAVSALFALWGLLGKDRP